MGLDVNAYSGELIRPVAGHKASLRSDGSPVPRYCPNRDHVVAFALVGFEQSLEDAEPGRCYEIADQSSGSRYFYAGSYSRYHEFRGDLAMAIVGITQYEIQSNPDKYRDKPFFELIYFPDNDGVIGWKAADRLAQDFRDHRDRYLAVHAIPSDADPGAARDALFMRNSYDSWQGIFEQAADGGLVTFS